MTTSSPSAVDASPPEGTPTVDVTDGDPTEGGAGAEVGADPGTGAAGPAAGADGTDVPDGPDAGSAADADAGPVPDVPAGPPRRTWPASKRARAAARRRARALGTWPPPSSRSSSRSSSSSSAGRPFGRVRPVPLVQRLRERRAGAVAAPAGARLRRRRAWVAVALATTTVAGTSLALVGLSAVRNSTAGRYVDPPVRPDQPGYQAYVTPTPTLAVVHRDAAGDLAGATLLALQPGDEGGAVVLVPPSTRAPGLGGGGDDGDDGDDEADGADGTDEVAGSDGIAGPGTAGTGQSSSSTTAGADAGADTGGGLTVAAAYEGGGADAVADAMADILGVAIDDVIEVDDARWASLVGPVAPVPLALDAPVGMWQPGEIELGPTDVGTFLAARGAGEPEIDWLARQAEFWDAWLSAVQAGGEGAVPGEIDTGIGRFVRGIARDPGAAILPVTPDADGGPVLTPDRDRISELVSRAVPYPLSPATGRRVRVRLLNGTTDDDLTPAAARLLVEGGAEITIAGNADTFDVSETTFAYESSDKRAAARRLADALGVGDVERGEGVDEAPTATAAEVESEIDVTIVLGSDAQDLIGRLESAG